jgi:hypothetical protein
LCTYFPAAQLKSAHGEPPADDWVAPHAWHFSDESEPTASTKVLFGHGVQRAMPGSPVKKFAAHSLHDVTLLSSSAVNTFTISLY